MSASLTAVVLAAAPILLLVLIYTYIRLCRNQSGETQSKTNALAKKNTQVKSNEKLQRQNKNGKNGSNKQKFKVKKVNLEVKTEEVKNFPEVDFDQDLFATKAFEEIKPETVSISVQSPPLEMKEEILVKEESSINDFAEISSLETNHLNTSGVEEKTSAIILESEKQLPKEIKIDLNEPELEPAKNDENLNEKVLTEAIASSSSASIILGRRNHYLETELRHLQAQLDKRLHSFTVDAKLRESQMSKLNTENSSLRTQIEHNMNKIKDLKVQIDNLSANILQERKEKNALEQHIAIIHQEKISDKEMYEAEKRNIYKQTSEKFERELKKNSFASAPKICKSLETQFGIQIPCSQIELEDSSVISTRIFKAITDHALSSNDFNSCAYNKPDKTIDEIFESVNSCIAKYFKNQNHLLLDSVDILKDKSMFEKWFASVYSSFNSDTNSHQLNGSSQPKENGTHSATNNTASDSNNFDFGDNRVMSSEIYFAFVDKLGEKNVPTLTTNINDWVDNLINVVEKLPKVIT